MKKKRNSAKKVAKGSMPGYTPSKMPSLLFVVASLFMSLLFSSATLTGHVVGDFSDTRTNVISTIFFLMGLAVAMDVLRRK